MNFPIVYVRGYAGSTGSINSAVDDPFYGFNIGATHVRVGGDGEPHFYQFESPLLRLLIDSTDDGGPYRIFVHGGQEAYLDSRGRGTIDPKTIWIHRFYDDSASTFGRDPRKYQIEDAAADLLRLTDLIRLKTGAEKVHLVAHSMGGLICRSLIQRVIPELTGRSNRAADYIESLFTYATPHNGIEFTEGFRGLAALRDTLDIEGAAIFGRDRMWQYLTPRDKRDGGPPEGWEPHTMTDEEFPLHHVFCLVGTNAADYDAALGLSARVVGPQSDGLVQIDNAYVPDTPRAFVHRSHSGRYGVVNSEEGYQNLRRFLTGDFKVEVELCHVQLPGTPDDGIVWQLETQLSVRGVSVIVHEQSTAHYCPIQIERPAPGDSAESPVPLLITFLSSRERPVDVYGDPLPTLRQALRLRLLSVREKGGIFGFFDHLEQTADFEDTLVVDIAPGEGTTSPKAWATWNSQLAGAIRDYDATKGAPIPDSEPEIGRWRGEVPMPAVSHRLLGANAVLAITVTPR
ncbi:hypothetical protein GCM10023168_29410 [Fodinibacter luteus]|uniref:AB hydrolase-1 domain-containing protein n=1 Tax=Fodinibacter luteus TaxID=552064 RepID=A0ABP8KLF8_9MICO